MALAAFLYGRASAQDLQRLTVAQLTLSSDTVSPMVEVPFFLIVTARVRERILELRNVDLPILSSEVELLGDERSVVTDTNGTTYTERIRVVAHHSGLIRIAPVTLDAIDARDGKAKRFSSNSLALAVSGGVAAVTRTYDTTGTVFTILWWLLILVAAALVVAFILKRRRTAPPADVVPQAPPVPVMPQVITREDRLRDARTVLEAERTRANVLRVRTMVRGMVGASDAETLADVLRRIEPEERGMRSLLFALERASFTRDGDLANAIDRVIERLNDMVGSPA